MSSRCPFLLQYFGDRHILLKDEWLNSVIDFLHHRLPQSTSFSDDRFASLVLDQWTCSNIEDTSFPVFGNHGFDANVQKQHLQGPIVCQVNGIIDVGSPYYQQFINLSGGGKKEDNSGFEKVFHEKEDDSDQKPSRLLKLAITDGESSLIAIEFWKCRHLSLHCKPGTKILIEPPCDIRRGTFLLKPNNCKILGGEVLPQLTRYLPLHQYARMLQIKDFKPTSYTNKNNIVAARESSAAVIRNDTSSASPSSVSSSAVSRPSLPAGPSSMISRYFMKKPTPCTPSTSSEKASEMREISPDVMANTGFDENDSENEDSEFQNHRHSTPKKQAENRRVSKDSVLVSSLLSRIQDDNEEFETSRRVPMKSPKKRNSITTTPTDPVRRVSGMLTSRRVNPMDELLENMIEKGEEPVSCTEKTVSRNPFIAQSQPPLKKVKIEQDSDDDDIQIIELVTPPPVDKKQKSPECNIKKREKEEEGDDLSEEEKAAVKAFSALKLSPLTENIKKMRFSVGSKRFQLLAYIEDIAEPLRVVDNLWTMKVKLRDETSLVEAFIDNQTLQNLIGYTCEEAMAVRKSSDLEKRKDGKRRLEALEQQLQRLDLVFEVEFFAGSQPSCPVIRTMKTLAEQLDVY
ncbi:unnamed protein product [Caenorhabditis brenneri]